ncbi:MAG: pilus assembly protein TadG-related protein [Desulfuromonadaceae bacterium]
MDSARKLTLLRDQKGLALVFIALLMVAVCGFIGLAVDMGYMYVAKGQLQNASDAAALAGAAKLDGTAFTAQTSARNAAKAFAEINPVVPGPDTTVAVSVEDITVGNWDPARSSTPSDLRFQADTPPINAVKVQARRTEGSIGGPVELFFSRVIDSRWARMGVSATAIASRTAKAGFYIMIGRNACSSAMPLKLSPGEGNMAWSSLLQPSTNADDVKDQFICSNKVPNQQVCGNSVYTTNGTATTIFQATETDFYDPDYDSVNKGIVAGVVTYWDVIVPVSTVSDPTVQSSPQPVWGYAKIRITRACGNGVGNACNAEDRLFLAPEGVCVGGEDSIVISRIDCISCENSGDLFGTKPNLVL